MVNECPSCREPLSTGRTTTTPCGHTFHTACLEGWKAWCVEHHLPQTCPNCRAKLVAGPRAREVVAVLPFRHARGSGVRVVFDDEPVTITLEQALASSNRFDSEGNHISAPPAHRARDPDARERVAEYWRNAEAAHGFRGFTIDALILSPPRLNTVPRMEGIVALDDRWVQSAEGEWVRPHT